MEIIKQFFPFLPEVQYDDLGDRGTRDEPAYGHDEQYSKWDQLSVITGDSRIDDSGLSLYLIQEFDSNKVYAKFYNDTVNYNGYGAINDEYTSEMDSIPVEEWDEERYESVLEDIKETNGWDEDEENEYPDEMLTR